MERITITIDTRYPAFADEPMTEVARILREIASRAETDGLLDSCAILDLKGNLVGGVAVLG